RRGRSKDASRSRQRRRDVRERTPPIQAEMREVGDPFRVEETSALREAEHEAEEKSDCRAQESAAEACRRASCRILIPDPNTIFDPRKDSLAQRVLFFSCLFPVAGCQKFRKPATGNRQP